MRRPCIDCGRLGTTTRCTPCQRAAWRLRGATRDPFMRRTYGSAAWRSLAGGVVASAGGCAYCHRADVALTADHVVAMRIDPSRALDPTNVVAACRSCQERRKRNPDWWGR